MLLTNTLKQTRPQHQGIKSCVLTIFDVHTGKIVMFHAGIALAAVLPHDHLLQLLAGDQALLPCQSTACNEWHDPNPSLEEQIRFV